jgi:hypothetical protein
MKKHINCDILTILEEAVERNTKAYKGDLEYDKALLRMAAKEPDGENNRFLWLSRKNGTVCLLEREVYIKESGAHEIWQYYANKKHEDEKFIAYAVEVTGIANGRVVGNLHEFDYLMHVEAVKKTNFISAGIEVQFEDGTELNIPYKEFHRDWDNYNIEYGNVVHQKHLPDNEGELQAVMKQARSQRDKQCRCSIAKVKPQNRKPSIRQQLAEEKQIAAIRATARVIAAQNRENGRDLAQKNNIVEVL